jgi:GNAT superfamily N-acetyltransferase
MEDLPDLHRLYGQLHREDKTSFEELRHAYSVMKSHPGCRIFVAVKDDLVVGTFALYLLPNMTRHGRMAAVIENVVVDIEYRRRGVGRAMIEYARDLACSMNCYKLSLTSNAGREGSHMFYEQCGMIRHGFRFRFEL